MNNKQDIKQQIILKTAIIKYYEFIPIVVYLIFLAGFIREGIDKTQIIVMTTLALIMIFIGVKRLFDNKPKIVIDSSGLELVEENLKLDWSRISDIQIGEKTVRKWNSFKPGYDSTVDVKCLFIFTVDNKKIEKVIEKYKFSNNRLRSILKFYIEKNKTNK